MFAKLLGKLKRCFVLVVNVLEINEKRIKVESGCGEAIDKKLGARKTRRKKSLLQRVKDTE